MRETQKIVVVTWHRRQCWQEDEWLPAHEDCLALWRVPGIKMPHTLAYDTMHSKYLGSDCYLQGAVLQYLVRHKLPGSEQENLEQVWTSICGAYAELSSPSRYGCLTLSMFQAGKNPFPCLKGKAAEVKHLIGPLLQVCQRHLDPSIHIEKVMLAAMESSLAIDNCLEENRAVPRFLPISRGP